MWERCEQGLLVFVATSTGSAPMFDNGTDKCLKSENTQSPPSPPQGCFHMFANSVVAIKKVK